MILSDGLVEKIKQLSPPEELTMAEMSKLTWPQGIPARTYHRDYFRGALLNFLNYEKIAMMPAYLVWNVANISQQEIFLVGSLLFTWSTKDAPKIPTLYQPTKTIVLDTINIKLPPWLATKLPATNFYCLKTELSTIILPYAQELMQLVLTNRYGETDNARQLS